MRSGEECGAGKAIEAGEECETGEGCGTGEEECEGCGTGEEECEASDKEREANEACGASVAIESGEVIEAGEATRGARRGESRQLAVCAGDDKMEPLPDECWTAIRDDRTNRVDSVAAIYS